MSDKPKPWKGSSGEHPAVKMFRAKMESISEHTMPMLQDLNAKLDDEIAQAKSKPPIALDSEQQLDDDADTPVVKDPRRDGDSDPPVDVVEQEKKP